MKTAFTLTVDLQVLNCARCGRNETVEPLALQKSAHFPGQSEQWRVQGWRGPIGWQQFRWPNGDESAACPECWPEVQRRAGLFIEELRQGVAQWVDPMTLCERKGCGHVRAAHVDGSCSTMAVGCVCTGFVEPAKCEACGQLVDHAGTGKLCRACQRKKDLIESDARAAGV